MSGLALLAACAEPPPYDFRRVSLGGESTEPLTAGGVTRPGWKFGAGASPVATDINNLTAGRIVVHAAPSPGSSGAGGVDVELVQTGWRERIGLGIREKCRLRWGEPGSPADAPWQSCTLELPRSMSSARLSVQRTGPAGEDVLLSEVSIEGNTARNLPSVFILLLDATRFDGLRPFRGNAEIGTNLEALSKDSIVLKSLRSSSSWTRPAVATLFTGLRADRHRVQDRGDVLPEEARTLAEILKERGYSTAAWSTNPNVLPVWGLAQGFDAFVDQGSASWTWGKTDGSSVVTVLRAALESRGKEPLFYYAHFMDPHAPYLPSEVQREQVEALPGIKSSFPRPLAILSAGEDWRAWLDYTGELLDVDEHVGTFVEALKRAGIYNDSLVIVLADHGEEFIDHGGRNHGRTLYEEVLHVPALIKLPGNRLAGTSMDESLSLVDIMPTMLSAIGIDAPPGLDGTVIDLDQRLEVAARPAVASLRLDNRRFSTIFDPPWKMIRNDTTSVRELYNLDKDPRERSNVVLWYPEVLQRLTSALDLMMSHGQEGWHLLLCGTLVESELDLIVRPSSGEVRPLGFQEGEAVSTGDSSGAWHLHPTLTPVEVERPAFGAMVRVVVPEQLELLVPPNDAGTGSTLEIRSASGRTLDVRAGLSGASRATTQIVLDSNAPEVVVSQGAHLECTETTKAGMTPVGAGDPFVRAWYVPPTPNIAGEKLDTNMQERLRALGYLQ